MDTLVAGRHMRRQQRQLQKSWLANMGHSFARKLTSDPVTIAVGVALLVYGACSAISFLRSTDEEEERENEVEGSEGAPGAPRPLTEGVLCADPYASSGYASSGYASSEDTIENEPAVAAPAIKQGARAERRPSFTITNEHGERRGSLNDETAQGWGWQVSDAPLYPDNSLTRRDSGVLRQSGSESEDADAPARTRRKARVRFATDKKVGFYGFIFSYEGATCIAHGADPSFAGLSLSAVLSRTNNREVDGDALHRRFIAAAEAGGGWVTYEWRNSSDAPLRLKGAYIIKLRASSMRTCYSGVGYSIMPPPARQPVATGYRVQGPPPARQPVDMGAHEAERMAGPVPCTARIAGPPINSPIHPEGLRRNTHVSAAPCVSPSRPAAKDRVQGTGYRGGVEVPGVPPSRAAAKAAAAGLERQLRNVDEPDARLIVASKTIPAVAGTIPAELEAVLRDHAVRHLQEVDEELQEHPLSPSVAALVGYSRRHHHTVALDTSLAALVGYDRRHRGHIPVNWR